jgi:hypothetical protein
MGNSKYVDGYMPPRSEFLRGLHGDSFTVKISELTNATSMFMQQMKSSCAHLGGRVTMKSYRGLENNTNVLKATTFVHVVLLEKSKKKRKGSLPSMTNEESQAALRFHETTHDEGTYDISKQQRTRLRELGLIEHRGGGRFYETELMSKFIKANT